MLQDRKHRSLMSFPSSKKGVNGHKRKTNHKNQWAAIVFDFPFTCVCFNYPYCRVCVPQPPLPAEDYPPEDYPSAAEPTEVYAELLAAGPPTLPKEYTLSHVSRTIIPRANLDRSTPSGWTLNVDPNGTWVFTNDHSPDQVCPSAG